MDDRQSEANLTISQFGRLSQLSRKALRLYDQRGVLVPAWTDPDSGYRYYSRAQVTLARRIRLLRAMDMQLEAVGAVLEAWDEDDRTAKRLIRAHTAAAE
jgi:DNA-binding transcriptional MerR regulator